ncbi:MAG: hypothetical protein OHK0031_06200 [Anaerolineales bacterium]
MKTARILFFLSLALSACAPASPTPFVAPGAPARVTAAATEIRLAAPTQPPVSALPPSATPSPAPSATPPCAPNLDFLADLNYPDGSLVAPGAVIEKQWRVRNSGNCAWSAAYRLRLVEGFSPLGAPPEQALYPALSGSEATLQITFTAPSEPGLYRSAWQAYDERGNPFGQTIFIEIVVQ